MTAAAQTVETTFAKVWNIAYTEILAKTTAGGNLIQHDGRRLHRLLCSYAVLYRNPSMQLPEHIVSASTDLTDEDTADLKVLGELGEECRQIERAIGEEWAALPESARTVLMGNAVRTGKRIDDFVDGMSLWSSLMTATITSANISWDIWTGIRGPDSSLFPRVVSLSASTAAAVLGFLISPGANVPQIYEAILQDRVVLGTPQRVVYTVGVQDDAFYEDRSSYIAAVAPSALTLLGLLTLPRPVKNALESRTVTKVGKASVSEEDRGEHEMMADSIEAKARVIELLQEKLRAVTKRYPHGEGTRGQITRISSQAHRLSVLLLRAVDRYVDKKHDEHARKMAVVVLWNAIIAAMLAAARNNLGQLSVLLSYVAHSERRMLEVLFDSSKGSDDMVDLFTRAGAPILYQFFFISVPLLARGRAVFDDPVTTGAVTATMTMINMTVIQYTPALVFMVGRGGRAALSKAANAIRRTGRQASAAAQMGYLRPDDASTIFFDAEEDIDTHDFFDAEEEADEEFVDAEEDQFFDAVAELGELWSSVTALVRDINDQRAEGN